jgi:hypothetical protein
VRRGGSTVKLLFSSSGIVLGYSNRAGEVQVELKSQRRAWEKEDRKALIQFHGCLYSLCVVGIMPLHICFLLHASFICRVCDFMEELKSECLSE